MTESNPKGGLAMPEPMRKGGYNDPAASGNGPTYHRKGLCSESGCQEKPGTAWGPYWCFKHNVERIDRITKALREITDVPWFIRVIRYKTPATNTPLCIQAALLRKIAERYQAVADVKYIGPKDTGMIHASGTLADVASELRRAAESLEKP